MWITKLSVLMIAASITGAVYADDMPEILSVYVMQEKQGGEWRTIGHKIAPTEDACAKQQRKDSKINQQPHKLRFKCYSYFSSAKLQLNDDFSES